MLRRLPLPRWNDPLTARIAADEASRRRLSRPASRPSASAEAERPPQSKPALLPNAEFDRQHAEARRQQEEADRCAVRPKPPSRQSVTPKRGTASRADRQRAELKAAQDALAEQQRKVAGGCAGRG